MTTGSSREPDDRKRYIEGLDRLEKQRKRDEPREPVPWLWLGMGILVTIAGIVIAVFFVNLLLSREPLSTSLPTPTIIRLTAAAGPAPIDEQLFPSPTPIPTFTPPPTPDLAIAPEQVTIGYYAEVVNTDGVGVILRGGPSTENIRVQLIDEGVRLVVIDGPVEGSDLLWWHVRLDTGEEGWIAADFLAPAARPE